MWGQSAWIIFGILMLGIFIGSNLGIMLMAMLHMAKRADLAIEDLVLVIAQSDELEPSQ
ncbi:MAG: hypothetical protein JW934_13925 [Anaerolineae bacterium]|nr:hypothetical protein [Anaerolineae bacterium]